MRILLWVVLAVAGLVSAASAQDRGAIAVGGFLHDQGPVSDGWEEGLDLNIEYQFRRWNDAPWNWLSGTKPHVGATINFSGDTNVVYAGLSWPWVDNPRWGFDFSLGLVAHDGDLEKDPERCELLDDCGFGSRIMFRVGFEGMWHFSKRWSAALIYDHVSHAKLLDDVNEGIDDVGVRLIYRF